MRNGIFISYFLVRPRSCEKQGRGPYIRGSGPCFGYEGFTVASLSGALTKLGVLVPVALVEEAALVEARLHLRGNLCVGLPQRCRYSKWSPRSLCSVWSLHYLY